MPDMEDEFSCDPYVISKNMGELDDGKRQEYTIGILTMCAGATGKKKGSKRKPSAWNCYIKKNKGQSFAELSPQFKNLSPKERREYEISADSGCE
ncbi:hypothetical protein LCGC14_1471150 [marine sediment metagenome]|uniref:Uncharacterized protein n=1 Tax=marine sediment metagenome TaxID=412755 RepID=A0A0F9LSS5_9ZZZZ